MPNSLNYILRFICIADYLLCIPCKRSISLSAKLQAPTVSHRRQTRANRTPISDSNGNLSVATLSSLFISFVCFAIFTPFDFISAYASCSCTWWSEATKWCREANLNALWKYDNEIFGMQPSPHIRWSRCARLLIFNQSLHAMQDHSSCLLSWRMKTAWRM